MYRFNKNIPEGTRDYLYDEALLLEDITARLAGVYEQEGFLPVKTPAIEYYDAFVCAGQPLEQEEMYKLTDTDGRLLVLRADNTTPTARVIATKLKNRPLPFQLYYNQNIYRVNTDYSGRRSEILQSGVEFAGVNGIRSDLICISTAFKAMESLGVPFQIEIGHVGFLEALIEELNLAGEALQTVREYINTKNSSALGFLGEEYDLSKIRELPRLYGEREVLVRARALAASNPSALEALAYIENLYQILEDAGYGGRIMIDFGIAHSLEYYTGLVFRGYMEGSGEAVLSGGRYDNMLKQFDYDIPATGFAINVCLVADALRVQGVREAREGATPCLIHFIPERFQEVDGYKAHLEERGFATQLSCHPTVEETVACAKNLEIPFVAVIDEHGFTLEQVSEESNNE